MRVEDLMLSEARVEIERADTKAAIVTTLIGVGWAALLGGMIAGDWIPSDYESPGEFIWWVAAIAAAAAFISAAAAVWPRFAKTEGKLGVRYWADAAQFDTAEELGLALEKQPLDPTIRTRQQLHTLSKIVVRKYTLVRWSMGLSGVAAGLFFIAALTG